jgi:hypothetical protein
MRGNFHVRFLEEGEGAILPSYSAILTDPLKSVRSVLPEPMAKSIKFFLSRRRSFNERRLYAETTDRGEERGCAATGSDAGTKFQSFFCRI